MADTDKDKPWYGALWNFMMAHKALKEASGQEQKTATPPDTDTSMVAKAAQEAGDRMEADKRAKAASLSANRVKGPQ